VAAVEVLLAAVAVLLDLAVPTIVILALAGISLLVRGAPVSTLGVRRIGGAGRMAMRVLGLTVGWTLLQVGLVIPLLEHATGETQDLGQFDGLEGDLGMLLGLLALSWTLAAVGEELAYRGYLQTRITDVLGPGIAGVLAAVAASSILFGLAHTEQGAIGVALTTLDAVLFSVLRIRYRTLWASVLAHGFLNTIGLVAFFLVGPIHGLW
jgi:membrane protease YdiL (CAAX protease family)